MSEFSNISGNQVLLNTGKSRSITSGIECTRFRKHLQTAESRKRYPLCISQIEASTCPPLPMGIPRAFDTFAVPGRREFDHQSLPGGGEFDPHALGVGNLNSTLDFM